MEGTPSVTFGIQSENSVVPYGARFNIATPILPGREARFPPLNNLVMKIASDFSLSFPLSGLISLQEGNHLSRFPRRASFQDGRRTPLPPLSLSS